MIIPDANLLVYAFNSSSPFHKAAAAWWEDTINSAAIVGIPWVVLLAFVRLLSSRTVVAQPYAAAELFELSDEWFEFESVLLLEPTKSTYLHFRDLMTSLGLPGTMTTDAFIAATAKEHNGTVYSNDSDFTRFQDLRLINPLL